MQNREKNRENHYFPPFSHSFFNFFVCRLDNFSFLLNIHFFSSPSSITARFLKEDAPETTTMSGTKHFFSILAILYLFNYSAALIGKFLISAHAGKCALLKIIQILKTCVQLVKTAMQTTDFSKFTTENENVAIALH